MLKTAVRMLMIVSLLATGMVATTSVAQAAGCPSHLANGSYCRIRTTRTSVDDLTDIATYPNTRNFGSPVASCSNVGGHCHLSAMRSISTSVTASLGASQKDISVGISFTLGVTAGSSTTCDTPRRLRQGERFGAWRLGTRKLYRVRHISIGRTGSTRRTSGRLQAFQPYRGVQIDCAIYKG